MSGFFHRLAQRANGTARVVRTAAPVAASWTRQNDAPVASAEAHVPTADDKGAVLVASQRLPHQEPVRNRSANPVIDDMSDAETTTRRAARHDAPSPMPVISTPAAAGSASVQTARPGPAPHPSTTEQVQEHGPDPARHGKAPQPKAHAPSPAGKALHTPSRPFEPAGDTQPLLAPVAPSHPQRSTAATAQVRRSPPSRPIAETTEVHVHIGRIDVTAPQPATPPRKTPRNGRAPLSLDDYLARRRGQTS